jgi:hypothetical protein
MAQQNAALRGTVADESKAVLPGVTVTVTDVTSGVQQVTVTGARGEYSFASLPPGRYALSAELPGFSAARVPEIELLVGQNATLPLTLKVGARRIHYGHRAASRHSFLTDAATSTVARWTRCRCRKRNWMELAMIVKGYGQRCNRRRRHPRHPVSAQPRRAANHSVGRLVGVWPAAVQP